MSTSEQQVNNEIKQQVNNSDNQESKQEGENPTEDYSAEKYKLPVVNPLIDAEFVDFGELPELFPSCEFKDQTFEEYNESVTDPKFRIYTPCTMTMELPQINFEPSVDGTYEDKKEKKTGKYTFTRIREFNPRGKDYSLSITTPAFLCPQGFKKTDTGNGVMLSMKGYFNMNNPQHRHFKLGIIDAIIHLCSKEIMKFPNTYGLLQQAYVDDSLADTKPYQRAYDAARALLKDTFKCPIIGEKQFDLESPVRTWYINPLDYHDKEKEILNDMQVFLPGMDTPVKPVVLENTCKGFYMKRHSDGVMEKVKGPRKGYECSAEILVTRMVKTSGTSVQFKCSKLFIHRFFEIQGGNGSAAVHLKDIQDRITADYEQYVGLNEADTSDEKPDEKKIEANSAELNPMAKHTKKEEVKDSDVLPEDNVSNTNITQSDTTATNDSANDSTGEQTKEKQGSSKFRSRFSKKT